MKWFQHYSDSYTNLKLQALIDKYGLESYGLWWICCELVGQQGKNYTLNGEKGWLNALKRITNFPEEKLQLILNEMANLGLIDKKALNKAILFIPKMTEYSDDYTKKLRRVSEQTTDNVRQDKIRLDKNRIPLGGKYIHKPDGYLMAKVGKVWRVKTPDGWKDFAGDEKDIIGQ